MRYKEVIEATFLERPNRFIAYCETSLGIEMVHVKNTGRCRELLIRGAKVYLEKSDNPARKTKYSLITVEKGERLINLDSQAPNQVVEEALRTQGLVWLGLQDELLLIQREKTYGTSRFDFYLETSKQKIFIEVKGVTLEEQNEVKFPDAPTERGVKHLRELIQAKQKGYSCFVVFVVQMGGVNSFSPHHERHAVFAKTLEQADREGVQLRAYTCKVTRDTLVLDYSIPVKL